MVEGDALEKHYTGNRIEGSNPSLSARYGENMKETHRTISAYNSAQTKTDREICELLRFEIDRALENSESKIWHGAPVWFLDGNPIVGYSKQKAGVKLMFWSGADFEEDELEIRAGKFKDASALFTAVEQIDVKNLKRWLKKSADIQWDYKNIVKNKGVLIKLLKSANN